MIRARDAAEEPDSRISFAGYDLVLLLWLILAVPMGFPALSKHLLLPLLGVELFESLVSLSLTPLLGIALLLALGVCCAWHWRRRASPRLGIELARAALLAIPPACLIAGASVRAAELLPYPPQLVLPLPLAAVGTGALSAYLIVLAVRLRARRAPAVRERA